jgi:hypothetical protein
MNDWIIKIVDVGYKLEKDIYIFRKCFDGKAEMLSGEKYDVGMLGIKPTLSLTNEQLQKFADSIAGIGIKPQEGYLDGKLQATEKHLEDMRKLVFMETIISGIQKND